VDAEVSRGVNRQAEDNAAAAVAVLGVPIHPDHHFTDEDRSASQFATKVRDAWVDLLARVRAGEATHVFVWLFDRAFRTTEAAEELLEACRQGGALIVQTAGNPTTADPRNPDDVFRLKLAGLLAEYEIAKMAMRQRRSKQANAELGRAPGGCRRFGYEPGFTGVRETEAAYIREAVTRFLAGESLHALCKWLNGEGALGAKGGLWVGGNLRKMLGAPHIAGLRVHKGQVIGPAAWPGIIPVETHHHVVAMLANPERRTNGTGSNARKWLMAGLMVCDDCGAPMRARPRTGRGAVPSYYCPTGRHVHRPVDRVDRAVELAVVERLARYDAAGLLVTDEASAELARLTEARAAMDTAYAELEAMRRSGELTTRAYATATAGLEDDIAATDAAIKVAAAEVGQSSRVLEGATGPAARAWWAGATLARRRAVIADLAEVRLRGGGRRGGRYTFRPTDVVVNWR
jgi:DNA invertase Pin-like site-specific DNA recombinase